MALKLIDWLWLIPGLPLLGAALNGLLGPRAGKSFVRVMALVGPSAAFLIAMLLFLSMVRDDRMVVVRGDPSELSELAVSMELDGWRLVPEGTGELWRVIGGPEQPAPDTVAAAVQGHGFSLHQPGQSSWTRSVEVGLGGEVAPRAWGSDLGPWISVGGFEVRWSLLLDRLSVILVLVITGVGSLIHLYSTSYMDGEETGGYARYFCYLNMFVGAMLILVLARDLLVMFIGWEGVGLCSYLLIGFHYQDPDNAACGTKAFVVNRIGDVGFVLGMLTLLALLRQAALPGHTFGLDTVRLNEVFDASRGSAILAVPQAAYWQGLACLLLFIGATGKSAQLPLHLWLPDAMAGPTPVSALIHAATMVTAGVYMICRLSHVFVGAAVFGVPVLSIVAVVGVLTGFLGVGGGFLIVPALVLFAGIETKAAVGSSLAIIALNAVGGLVGQMQQVSLNWPLTLSFLGLALVGMFGGLFVAEKVPGESLSKAFGWFVVVLALVIGVLAAAGVRTPSLTT